MESSGGKRGGAVDCQSVCLVIMILNHISYKGRRVRTLSVYTEIIERMSHFS